MVSRRVVHLDCSLGISWEYVGIRADEAEFIRLELIPGHELRSDRCITIASVKDVIVMAGARSRTFTVLQFDPCICQTARHVPLRSQYSILSWE